MSSGVKVELGSLLNNENLQIKNIGNKLITWKVTLNNFKKKQAVKRNLEFIISF